LKLNFNLHINNYSLVDLYNLDVDLSRKFTILIAILNYANLTQQGDALLSQFKSIEEWIKELQVSVEKRRELCFTLLQLLKNKSQSMQFLTIYLKTFDKESELVIESAFENIQQLVLITIKNPEVHHLDILNLHAISIFKDKPFYKLVELFTVGQARAFREYFSNINYLSQSDFELLLEKMRTLTITSIFSSKQIVLFSEIASALDIEESDVEAWVVDVASKDLVSVRIDQPRKQINVKHSAKRSFDEKDWALLGNRVSKCRENMNDLLETVRRAKQANLQNMEK